MEIKEFFADPIHAAVSSTLNDKVLSNKYTDTAANVINLWIKDQLLDDVRDNSKKWRRFSLIEAIWVNIISELRDIGFGKDKIKIVKQDLLSSNSKINSPYPFLEYHLITNMLYKKPYFIVIDREGATNILGYEAYIQLIQSEDMISIHIVFWLGGLFEKVLQKMNVLKTDFSQFFKLSKEELELLSFIKQNDFQTIKITRKNGEIDRLEGVERMDREKRIIDILNDGDYQNLELKQEDGKVVCIHRTVKKKL